MKSLLKILIAVFAVCLIAPAFSAVENVKVGGDIAVYGVLRGDFEGTENLHGVATIARVYVSADLSENVSTMVRFINERVWGSKYFEDDDMYYPDWIGRGDIQLDLGYIKVKDLLTPGLTLTVGRQEIEFGEGLVIGSRYVANPSYPSYGFWAFSDLGLQKAFDAVRLDYTIEPVSLTLIYSKILETYYGTDYESNLYGMDIGFKLADVVNVDVYYAGVDDIIIINDLFGDLGILHTGGIRIVSGIPGVPGLSLKAEWAKQFGKDENGYSFKGWALLAGIKYEIPANMNPVIKLNYNRFSGDDEDTDAYENWISVFPSNVGSRIGPLFYAFDAYSSDGLYANMGNLQVINLGFGLNPTEKLGITLDAYWIDQLIGDNEFGYEVDLGFEYKYTEDLTFGVKGGKIFGGNYFGEVTPSKPWQVLTYAKIAF
ncbi:MAG: alginate export family protein [Candidatus Omnitrophica bacterium]|nr:alginate export family protein [Candidatus Omnitrophota bacterium]